MLVEAIYGETEGNPFFVEEVFKHLREEGKLFAIDGGWRSDIAVDQLDVPESVRLVVGRRLERLGEECRKALAVAAVIGRSFDYTLLTRVDSDIDGDSLLDAIDEAERAHLVVSEDRGAEVRFTFAHELTRQTLLSGLSTPRRQRLHLRIADAMERLYADSITEHADDLSHHLLEAGATASPERSARYHAMAGERALETAAFEEALRLFETALAATPTGEGELRASILARQGRAYRSLGRWTESQAALAESIAILEDLGLNGTVGDVCAELAFEQAWASRWEECLVTAGRGLQALSDIESPQKVGLLGLTGVILSLSGNFKGGEEMTEEAHTMGTALGDRASLANALAFRSIHKWAFLELQEAVELGLQAKEYAAAGADLWRQVDLAPFVAMALAFLDRTEEAIGVLDEVEPLAERLGHRQAGIFVRRVRIVAQGVRNRAEYEQFVARDMESAVSIGRAGTWIQDALGNTGQALLMAGRLEESADTLRQAIDSPQPWIWNESYAGLLMVALAAAGKREEVIEAYAKWREDLPGAEGPASLGAWSLALAACVALFDVGEEQESHALYPLIQRILETGTRRAYGMVVVDTIAGLAATAGGLRGGGPAL